MDKNEFNSLCAYVCKSFDELKRECETLLTANETAEQAYQRGLDEAWEAARKIIAWFQYVENQSILDRFNIDGTWGESVLEVLFNNQTAEHALAKIREYEERKKAEDEAIKVGDEVITDGGTRFAVTFVCDDGKRCAGYGSDGKHCGIETAYCHKTGRHFPQIAEVLGQIANGKDTT